MEQPSRQEIQKIFKKVKHLRLPLDYDEIDFSVLHYLGWHDATDKVSYMVYKYKGKWEGIKWALLKLAQVGVKLGTCVICGKHRSLGDIALISAKTKFKDDVDYRVRGDYVCSDFGRCNLDLKNTDGLDSLFRMIFEKE